MCNKLFYKYLQRNAQKNIYRQEQWGKWGMWVITLPGIMWFMQHLVLLGQLCQGGAYGLERTETRNAHRILGQNPLGGCLKTKEFGRAMLNWIIGRFIMKIWTSFNWLRTVSSSLALVMMNLQVLLPESESFS